MRILPGQFEVSGVADPAVMPSQGEQVRGADGYHGDQYALSTITPLHHQISSLWQIPSEYPIGIFPLEMFPKQAPSVLVGWHQDLPVLLVHTGFTAEKGDRYSLCLGEDVCGSVHLSENGDFSLDQVVSSNSEVRNLVIHYLARCQQFYPPSWSTNQHQFLPERADQLSVRQLIADHSFEQVSWRVLNDRLHLNNGFFTTTGYARHFNLYRYLANELEGQDVRRILVVGVGKDGDGQVSDPYEIAAIFPRATVTSVDVEDDAIAFMKRATQGVSIKLNGEYVSRLENGLKDQHFSLGLKNYFDRTRQSWEEIVVHSRVFFDSSVTNRVMPVRADLTIESLPEGESGYDLIVCLNTLRYLEMEKDPYHRIRSVSLDIFDQLADQGTAILNGSSVFSFDEVFDVDVYQRLGIDRTGLQFTSLEKMGLIHGLKFDRFDKKDKKPLLAHLATGVRHGLSLAQKVREHPSFSYRGPLLKRMVQHHQWLRAARR